MASEHNLNLHPYPPTPTEDLEKLSSMDNLAPPRMISADSQPASSAASLQETPFLKQEDYGSTADALAGLPREGLLPEVQSRRRKRALYKRPWFWVAAVALVVVAVVLAVYFGAIRPKQHHGSSSTSSASSSGSGSSSGSNTGNTTSPTPQATITYGGDGSTVTKDDGTTFTYTNPFGGYWVSNLADPFDNSARPNSWTPALNETWDWSTDRINGVNIGGLFVPEPFIVPALFEDNPDAVDEWTLSMSLAAKGQLQEALEAHYDTFIMEEDIAQIAGAGLNWIRVPIPFWAVEVWSNVGVDESGETVGEPFLARICWKYILRLLGWARKYGLRVLIDLHTAPGSQNGFNHSGMLGDVNWLYGVMGIANAQRSLDYIRAFTEFITQPEYQALIPIFGVLNEPRLSVVGRPQLESFYLQSYEMVREITGIGEGQGPMIALHTGFDGITKWAGFMSGADRIILDDHPYFAFDGNTNRQPINTTADGGDGVMLGGQWPQDACNSWGNSLNTSRSAFGITIAGEFSNGINDCGLWVNGVNKSAVYGSGCEYWQDASGWSDETKEGLLNFALASMDALGDYFFWTWKIGNASTTGTVQSPLWSYQLGLQNGWMLPDPRAARGMCAKLGVEGTPFDGQYESWMTGGAGAGTLAASATETILAWPPTLSPDVPTQSALQYTSTGTMVTLPPQTFSATAGVTPTASVGDGWADPSDVAPAVAAASGCAYPFAWGAASAPFPASGCPTEVPGAR